MHNKHISVIIPTYNRFELLQKCMDSLFKQTYSDIEIIVVNNGSKDGTSEYLKKLEIENKIKLIEFQENTGSPYACYNSGINEASGEYTVFMYDDDTLVPDAIESIVNIVKNNKYIMISAPCILEGTNKLTITSYGDKSRKLNIKDVLNSRQGNGEESINFVLTSIIKKYSFDESAYGGEGLVWLDIINTYGVYYLHKGLRIYKKNNTHVQFTSSNQYFANIDKILYSTELYMRLYDKINADEISPKRYLKHKLLFVFLLLVDGQKTKVLKNLVKNFKFTYLVIYYPLILLLLIFPKHIIKYILININNFRLLLRNKYKGIL